MKLSTFEGWNAHDIIHIMRNTFFLTALVTLFACSAAPAQQTDAAARVGNFYTHFTPHNFAGKCECIISMLVDAYHRGLKLIAEG